MNLHAARVLDFSRLLERLAAETRTPQGADLCRATAVAPNSGEARRRVVELSDFGRLTETLGWPPVDGVQRVEEFLDHAATPGACLDVEAMLAVRDTVAAAGRVIEYLEDAARDGSPLGDWAEGHAPLYDLEERFARTFGPRGEILDGASPELAALRDELKTLRVKVLRTLERLVRDTALEHVVRDDFITQRSNRYVVPLTPDFRGALQGIVHDHSRTGQTVFVEPLAVVETNNRVNAAKEEEAEEIRRILLKLTAELGARAPVVRGQVALVARMDALAAKLRLALRLKATRPEIVDSPLLDVGEARHPFLALREESTAVPVDLRVEEEVRLLLITGANAGGKTVALKTAGLLTLMAHAGFFIPAAEGSRVGWFPEVLADIGDEQDLDRDLSTFTAHMARLKEIFDWAGPGSLVLLDELGTGTDPQQGAALAVAVLEELRARGAHVLATTHLDGLKAYAYGAPQAKNAAVAFDPRTGTPLYRLLYGQAGSSNALDTAERMGLPERVLDRARSLAGEGGEGVSRTLRDLEKARDEAREEAERARRLVEAAEKKMMEREDLLAQARDERRRARSEARAEAVALLRRMRDELQETVRRFAEEKIPRREAQQAMEEAAGDIERRFPRAPEEAGGSAPAPARLKAGTEVFVRSLGKRAVVEEAPSGGKVRVRAGPLRLTVELTDLGGVEASPSPPVKPIGAVRVEADRTSPDVVLIGRTTEEALEEFDRAVNRALVGGVDRFRVVHGRGTGALRRVLRERIASDPHLKRVEMGESDEAVTWVEIV